MKKVHKIIPIPINKEIEVGDIVKCIKTPENTSFPEDYKIGSLSINKNFNISKSQGYYELQQLLLLSDEEIKEGDNWLYIQPMFPCKDNYSYTHDDLDKKIIASYPQLDNLPTFSKEFIQEWCNNPVDEVEVEYEEFVETIYNKGLDSNSYWSLEKLKLTSNNEIICSIPSKDYRNDSVYEERNNTQLVESPCDFSNDPVILEEKVKEITYSESEVKQLTWEAFVSWYKPMRISIISKVIMPEFQEWFDNHKKK